MIRIGIVGYGNLAKGVECAVRQSEDMSLCAVFTRRDPKTVQIKTENIPVLPMDQADAWVDKIDVMILCGGSATDLPVMTPAMAAKFNVVDSFDNHAAIPNHFANVDAAARESGRIAFISVGWDPGLFSLNRLYAAAILPAGQDYTFWQRTPLCSRIATGISWSSLGGLKGVTPPEAFGERSRDWSLGHAGDEGPQKVGHG